MKLEFDPEVLRPLIERVVAETVAMLQGALPGDRLAFSEEEAARLLGLQPHQLRDERRRGRVVASKIVGRRIRYQRADLIAYLTERQVNQKGTK